MPWKKKSHWSTVFDEVQSLWHARRKWHFDGDTLYLLAISLPNINSLPFWKDQLKQLHLAVVYIWVTLKMRYWSQTFILASKLKNFLLCFLYIKILKLKINKWTTFTFMQIKLSCTEELFNIEIKILHIFREWWVILGNKVKMYVFLYLLLFYYRLNGNFKTILNFNGKHTVTIWNNLKVTNEKLHFNKQIMNILFWKLFLFIFQI